MALNMNSVGIIGGFRGKRLGFPATGVVSGALGPLVVQTANLKCGLFLTKYRFWDS